MWYSWLFAALSIFFMVFVSRGTEYKRVTVAMLIAIAVLMLCVWQLTS